MKERILAVRHNLKLSQEQFGENIGVSRSVIRNLEDGITKLRSPLFNLFCKTYNVNPKWLQDGEGEMFNPEPHNIDPDPLILLKQKYSLSDEALHIIENILNLSLSEQKDLYSLFNKIIKMHQSDPDT